MKQTFLLPFLILFFILTSGCENGSKVVQNGKKTVGSVCTFEGSEACSNDNSSILFCRSGVWLIKESCDPNLNQSCQKNDSGDLSCASSSSENDGDTGGGEPKENVLEGDFTIHNESDLASLSEVNTVTGTLSVDPSAALTSIELPNLKVVYGLNVESGDNLKSIAFPKLSEVRGIINIGATLHLL